jgi:hypothetical protein
MTTPRQFIQLASVIEGLPVSAYLGAAPAITNKVYVNAAASILVTEDLHQVAHRNAIEEIPMVNAFGTSLGLNDAFSIASTFIKSYPFSHAALPVMAYPSFDSRIGFAKCRRCSY